MKGFKSVQHLSASVTQAYIFPRAAWDVPAQRATMVDCIPFTHPAHVPALVMLLRHQSTISALLRSCMATAVSECDNHILHVLLLQTTENLLLSHKLTSLHIKLMCSSQLELLGQTSSLVASRSCL